MIGPHIDRIYPRLRPEPNGADPVKPMLRRQARENLVPLVPIVLSVLVAFAVSWWYPREGAAPAATAPAGEVVDPHAHH